MSVSLQDLIDTIEQDPAAVREALALIKRTINDLPAMTQVSDSDAWAIRNAAAGVDQRVTLGALLSSITGTAPDEVPTNADFIANSIAEIGAIDAESGHVIQLNYGGRSGVFDVVAGDYSTELASDTFNAIYAPVGNDPTGSSKVARRRFTGRVDFNWFGAKADNVYDNKEEWSAFLGLGRPGIISSADDYYYISDGEKLTTLVDIVAQSGAVIRYDNADEALIKRPDTLSDYSVLVEGLNVDYDFPSAAISHLVLETEGKVVVRDCTLNGSGVKVRKSERASIKNCTITSSGLQGDTGAEYGIFSVRGRLIDVIDNYVYNFSLDNVKISTPDSDGVNDIPTRFNIRGNYLEGAGDDGIDTFSAGQGGTVTENIIVGGAKGIQIKSVGDYPDFAEHIICGANICIGQTNYAIGLQGGNHFSVINNVSRDCTGNSAFLIGETDSHSINISGNHVYNCALRAFTIGSLAACTITNNMIDGAVIGYRISGSSGAYTMQGGTIGNCSGQGVFVNSVANVTKISAVGVLCWSCGVSFELTQAASDTEASVVFIGCISKNATTDFVTDNDFPGLVGVANNFSIP